MTPIEIALSQYGVAEYVKGDNATILNYSKEAGITGIDNEGISWCSIFMNWVFFKAGLPHSKSASARSWLNVGVEVKEPQIRDVVVLWRDSVDSWKGHVGLFVAFSEDKRFVYILGGNQGDKVCIEAFAVVRVLQYRRIENTPS
jgi:uncharacterized protein (TIGR02594 family)